MKTTEFYKFPLQWDQYPDDRVMIEEAFVRIDKKLHDIIFDGGGSAANIIYDGIEALPGESVAEALDRALARTNQFEIAANATAQSDANEILWSMAVTRPFTLPADLEGTLGTVLTLAPIDLVIRIEQNGDPIGSIDIVQNTMTFTFPTDVVFAREDELTFISEGDVTFRSISVNLLASRL